MKQSFATAQPRVSLLGNPSDIYGGFGLGFPIWNWQAKVFLDTSISTTEEIPLLQAAREVFSQYHTVKQKFGLRFFTDIPLQAGLAGSSALVMAALRAMGEAHGVHWTWKPLADATLNVEQRHLGIIAGPMDRWIQAQKEFLWMDFSGEKTEVLPIETLPSLRILIPSKPGMPRLSAMRTGRAKASFMRDNSSAGRRSGQSGCISWESIKPSNSRTAAVLCL